MRADDVPLLSHQAGFATEKGGVVFNSLMNRPYGAGRGWAADPKAGGQRRRWLAAPGPGAVLHPGSPPALHTHLP